MTKIFVRQRNFKKPNTFPCISLRKKFYSVFGAVIFVATHFNANRTA